jgi:acyl carrier protein
MAEHQRISGRGLPSLREVITAGEALKITPAIADLFRNTPGCRLQNQYGPSESHVVTAFTLGPDVNAWPVLPPIGRPIPNSTIYILDEHYQPLPIGVGGELFIGGPCLAQGYLNRPELTAERFIANPWGTGRLYKTGDLARYRSDGNIEYLDRIDQQVKIRGFRVELGEIEVVLSHHDQVQQCGVVAREDRSGSKRLVAYIVVKQKQPTINDLRSFLQTKLPDYLIPSDFVFLETLPLTPNGKVDRRALPAPESVRPELAATFVIPKTRMEKLIAAIWQEVLNLEKVGIHDNFFDLGGHSLLIAQVKKQLQDLVAQELSMVEIFTYPTIHSLANYLQEPEQLQPREPRIDRADIRKSRRGLVKQKKQLREKYHSEN